MNQQRQFIRFDIGLPIGSSFLLKYGFALRVVAEGHPGDDRIKYVHTVDFKKQGLNRQGRL